MTICLIIIGICILGICFCVFMLSRNDKVYKFGIKLCDLVYEHNIKNLDDFIDLDCLPDYDDMFYSFKKLKIENWLSEDVIKKLKKENDEIKRF